MNAAKVTAASAYAGALLLAVLADGAGVVNMSAGELSCRLNCSQRTARRTLQELRASGVLHQLRPGGGRGRRASRYYLSAGPIVRGSEVDPCR